MGRSIRWPISSTCSLAAQIDGRYPYPFIDVGQLGWLQIGDQRRRPSPSAFILAGFAARLDRPLASSWVDARDRR